ncbi:DUF1579 domain-containing protein [Catenulispora pinisilvae]|uniref:DUF1579 domain-containing protein n=2 Tax=Catenulispora pinisilvae TaxID=2705253 RepID=UPI00189211E8|nr:DUF1579 domain-containing protein [Catenulispora pinisilvae]
MTTPENLIDDLTDDLTGDPTDDLTGDLTGDPTDGPTDDLIDDGRHDFDFLAGTWHVRHRKLADMADPECREWVEFDGVHWLRQTLGGLGNVDNQTLAMPNGAHEGMSLRLFDPETRLWNIWWAATGNPGHLEPPVSGRWDGTHGEFRGPDSVGGKPIEVRFTWDVFDADTARWEQAFSFDEGDSWVHNWRMSFTRVSYAVQGSAEVRSARSVRSVRSADRVSGLRG